uniref:AraC family transcriptional regulator n=1 Tax=Eubacterium sp. TaxID=142586 RepID=UPI004027EC38
MNYSELYEDKRHGTIDFPFELYCVNKNYPRYEMPFHWHVEYEMIIVKKGQLKLILDGKSFYVNEGESAFISGGVVHGGIPEECEYYCIVFDLASLFKDVALCSKSVAIFLTNADCFTGVYGAERKQSAIMREILYSMQNRDNGYDLNVIGLLWKLLGAFVSEPVISEGEQINKSQRQKLKDVLSYIRKNIDKNITLEELAQVSGMSPRYFCRVFKSMTGRTPIEYVNYYRIETASQMLITTGESVTDIALNCGFNDMSYFSKMFKKLKGISPSKFRQAL